MKKKSKSKEVSQQPYTFRMDNENLGWLQSISEARQTAKGRIINNIIKDVRENTPPSDEDWQRIRKRLLEIREQMKQCVIDLYDTITDKDRADDDELPDTLTNYIDKKP